MRKSLIEIWKSRGQIIEGIQNSIFKKADVEVIAAQRAAICDTNVCRYNDPLGLSPNAYFPGEDTCGACGCKKAWKLRSLSSECGLSKLGKQPLWTAILTKEEEDQLRLKLGT